jgi:hypothetical protein
VVRGSPFLAHSAWVLASTQLLYRPIRVIGTPLHNPDIVHIGAFLENPPRIWREPTMPGRREMVLCMVAQEPCDTSAWEILGPKHNDDMAPLFRQAQQFSDREGIFCARE